MLPEVLGQTCQKVSCQQLLDVASAAHAARAQVHCALHAAVPGQHHRHQHGSAQEPSSSTQGEQQQAQLQTALPPQPHDQQQGVHARASTALEQLQGPGAQAGSRKQHASAASSSEPTTVPASSNHEGPPRAFYVPLVDTRKVKERRLNSEDMNLLNKLVGLIMKDGKKTIAQVRCHLA